MRLRVRLALPLFVLAFAAGCRAGEAANDSVAAAPAARVTVTIATAAGERHRFTVPVARTPDAQQRGLIYVAPVADDGGMLFAPYPPEGGPPRVASFWMKDTPSPLDILFIRADGTIARIAENAVPFSETLIGSGEPVAAVLEVRGGRASELGIAEGDRVDWPGRQAVAAGRQPG